MALGRGLASLIPKRDSKNAEDVLERIDTMEYTEEEDLRSSQPAHNAKTVNVFEDFDDLDDEEQIEMPKKPLVTPLTIDSDTGEIVAEQKTTSLTVEEEDEVDVSVVESVQDEVVAEDPFKEVEVPEAPEEGVIPEEEDDMLGIEEDADDVEMQPDTPEEEVVPAPTELDDVEKAVVTEDVVAEVQPDAQEDAVMPNFGEGNVGESWDKHEDRVVHVPIGDIRINPLQPRSTFDPEELEELRSSIDQHGILQPLVVRRMSGSEGVGYELIAGERRLRAAKSLNWDKVPAVVRMDVNSDQSRLVFALIENIQRQNLSPVEEAEAYMKLNREYGLTHEEIGERVGKSRVGVTNILRVLQLPAEIQRGLTEGKITLGHAKAILMIPDEDKQLRFYNHLLDEGLTVRKAEIRARRIQRSMNLNDPMRKNRRQQHPLAVKYSPALEERYGYNAQVKFNETQNRFEVHFRAFSEQEVQELVSRLLGTTELPHYDEDIVEKEEE